MYYLRTVFGLLPLIIGMLVIMLCCGLSEGNVITVDDDGPSDHSSIQDAIDEANDGDVVSVFPGEYFEHIFVNKSITLEGKDKETTIINGSGTGVVVRVNADWVNISGITVTEGGGGAADAAIFIQTDYNTIMDTICTGNGYTITLDYANHNTLKNNHCMNNDRYGIKLWFSNHNTLLNNNCSHNKWEGIHIYQSSDNHLADNIIANNERGIYQKSLCKDITYINNTFRDNALYALRIHYSENANLSQNEFINNGLYVSGSMVKYWNTHQIDATNTVNGNPIFYAKNGTGLSIPEIPGQIILANCSQSIIHDSDISKASIGIAIGFSDQITLSDNQISLNNYGGIHLYGSSNVTLKSNSVTDSIEWGISLIESTRISVQENICEFNDGYGIYLIDSDNITLSKNHCVQNTNGGILIYNSDDNILTNNTISGNTIGIKVASDSHNNFINYNMIYSNIDSGINAIDNDDLIVDATNNYWGDSTGPYHPINNTNGLGDNVTGHVTYDPWLTEAIKNIPMAFIDLITPNPVNSSEELTLSGHGVDEGSIIRYVWRSSVDGEIYNGTESSFSIHTLSSGNHTIYFKVQNDDLDWSEEDTLPLVVNQSTNDSIEKGEEDDNILDPLFEDIGPIPLIGYGGILLIIAVVAIAGMKRKGKKDSKDEKQDQSIPDIHQGTPPPAQPQPFPQQSIPGMQPQSQPFPQQPMPGMPPQPFPQPSPDQFMPPQPMQQIQQPTPPFPPQTQQIPQPPTQPSSQPPSIPGMQPQGGNWSCPGCGSMVDQQYVFCMSCGFKRS